MIPRVLSVVFCCALALSLFGQRCDSISARYNGDWRPISAAPRDGTVIETLETYGIAPTYGLFKWGDLGGRKGWVSPTNHRQGHVESACLFWRPYHGDVSRYRDPTNGAQYGVEYWCVAAHMRYSRKRDRCY